MADKIVPDWTQPLTSTAQEREAQVNALFDDYPALWNPKLVRAIVGLMVERERAAYEIAAQLAYTRAAQIYTELLSVSAVEELNALGDKLTEYANRAAEGEQGVTHG